MATKYPSQARYNQKTYKAVTLKIRYDEALYEYLMDKAKKENKPMAQVFRDILNERMIKDTEKERKFERDLFFIDC